MRMTSTVFHFYYIPHSDFLFSLSGCYPYYKEDPFVLEECPHIYFVGNQPRLEYKTIEGLKHFKKTLKRRLIIFAQ